MNKFITILLLCSVSLLSNAQKVAHVNSQEVMAAMPSYNQAVQKLDQFQREIEVELRTMENDYQIELEKYLKERDDLSPVMRQIREENLGKKQQAYQERQQSAQQEVEAYSRELNAPIVKNIEAAIETVSKKNNCDYVFDVSVLMIYKGLDLTQEVIEEVKILENQSSSIPQEVNIREKQISPPPQVVIKEEIRP